MYSEICLFQFPDEETGKLMTGIIKGKLGFNISSGYKQNSVDINSTALDF